MTDHSLDPVEDLSFAREILRSYHPRDEQQRAFQDQLLGWIEAHPTDAHTRECLAGHLTGSALLLDASREHVLLHHHRKLGLWLQFGGHCDGDANLRGVAWRETAEESGIVPAWMSRDPIDLDVHEIPARPGEPAHLHLDVRYLATAPSGATGECSEESLELHWFSQAEARALDLDPSLARILDLAFPA